MLDLDVEGFADRLGAGPERLVSGELTLLVDMPDTAGADLDAETKRMFGRMVITMCTVSECIALMEGAALACWYRETYSDRGIGFSLAYALSSSSRRAWQASIGVSNTQGLACLVGERRYKGVRCICLFW